MLLVQFSIEYRLLIAILFSSFLYILSVLKLFKVGSILIGHTPQSFTFTDGINSTCGNQIWRVDNGSSCAFAKYDKNMMEHGEITESRKAQVLEILNDNEYNIIKS